MNGGGGIGPESSLAEDIRRLVDAAPPLSETQRSRLVPLLRPFVPAAKSAETYSHRTQAAA